jgi:hypothetical protein
MPTTSRIPAKAGIDFCVVHARREYLNEHFACTEFWHCNIAVVQFVKTAISRRYHSLHGINTRDN